MLYYKESSASHSSNKCICEFTLALNNATGKYFFCLDMIKASSDLFSAVYYWRFPFKKKPPRLVSRVLGRLALIETKIRLAFPRSFYLLPLISRRDPVLFTDPRETVLYKLKSSDIVLCHDLGPITHVELYSAGVRPLYMRAFEQIEQVKPLMLFISDASRSAFIHKYGNDYPLMEVVYPPIREGIDKASSKPMNGILGKFFLTVGSIGARKNQFKAIKAFALSGLAQEGFSYVLSGGEEPGSEEVLALARNTRGLILTGYVSDPELRWLYANASGFVLPSLLEGFGLPAAEAILWGLIPLIGRTGALHEVAGDGAVLVDPTDVADIARGMRELADIQDAEREERLRLLRRNIDDFSLEAALSTWRGAIMKALCRG